MYRQAINDLLKWKNSNKRKPLIIRGARQVGKTWLMKEFGRQAYDAFVYINFESNHQLRNLFVHDINIEQIINGIEIIADHKINPQRDLIIFDEVQAEPRALTSLKYFAEEAPQYHIVCAGSLLGVALHEGTSFPVGKVDFVDLYPLSFAEFMVAVGKKRYVELIEKGNYELANGFADEYRQLLRYYYFVGGMPEAVVTYIDNNDLDEVRMIQRRIIDAYQQDFSKHAPNEIVPRIRMLFENIPSQLSKENKKFVYSLIRSGARAREYELALTWLTDCGLLYRIPRIKIPKLPLKAYEDFKAFKLYMLDVGLLACMSGLDKQILLDGNDMFVEFKGALSEQYVIQQLKKLTSTNVYYWTNEAGKAEIDFVIERKGKIIPIEVKSEINLKAKSLAFYHEKFQPEIALRISMADYKVDDWVINLPLWAVFSLDLILK